MSLPQKRSSVSTPPDAWGPAHRAARRVLGPLERYLHVEAASGVALFLAALVALVWANSPWASSYDALWHTPVTVGLGGLVFTQTLHFWINDGLMAVFFFVVGLEIRREVHQGELADLRRAALPIGAALGGMVVPALIYTALSAGGPAQQGWGVPMATDIAFAVGVLALLGKRVPPALRVLLLALAIIDDIGAILIIALFYSDGIAGSGLLIAAAGCLGVLVFQWVGVRRTLAYVAPGAVIWVGMLVAGIHPTIAGVILGLMTPVRSWFGEKGFVAVAEEAIEDFRRHASSSSTDPNDLIEPLRQVAQAGREALPPVIRIQARLHPWVAFGIMPLFALANAGVPLGGVHWGDGASVSVLLGVSLGLVLGKPLGVVLVSFIMVKVGLCRLPVGVHWSGIGLVGIVAGIGFTMAIFIAGLAFDDPGLLAAAKLAVLIASGVAAAVGFGMGTLVLPKSGTPGAARTLSEAEESDLV